jgi:transcriptional regulator
MNTKLTKITRTGKAIVYTRRSDEISEMVKRGLRARDAEVIKVIFKRSQLKECLKEVSKDIVSLIQTRRDIENLLKN